MKQYVRMKRPIIITFFLLFILYGCSSNNNDTLLSSLDNELKVSPISGIVTYCNELKVYRNSSSYFGFTSRKDDQNNCYFYRTYNRFFNISLISIPYSTSSWNLEFTNNNVMVAWSEVYSAQNNNKNITTTDNVAIQSNDGGNTWRKIITDKQDFGEHFLGVCPIDKSQGIYFTYNNWNETMVYSYSSTGQYYISSIKGYCVTCYRKIAPNIIYLITNSSDNVTPSDKQDSYFIASNDAGHTWSKPIEISKTKTVSNLFCFNNKMIAVPSAFFELNNYYFESSDNGKSWNKKTVDGISFIRSVYFVNEKLGFIKTGTSGLWSQSNPGDVYKTVDGGNNWTKVNSNTVLGSKIYFNDENIGFLQDFSYGSGQFLLETEDGGKNWREVLYPYPYVI